MNILTKDEQLVKPFTRDDGRVEFVEPLADGPHYNEEKGEYEIWLNGELVTWASDPIEAGKQYLQALRQRNAHLRRCPDDSWWNVETVDYTASVDRQTGAVTYTDKIDEAGQ